MKNQKKYVLGLVISIIALAVGVSYAYFTATFQNLGVRETSITLAELGSLKLTASEATYTSGGQYPGDMAIQKFIVEPVSRGSGIYEIDLTGVIDESIFGSDVEIQLYKSLDNTEVTVTEGELEKEGKNFSRVDTLVTNGLTPIYTGSLKNGLNILYQEDFEVIEESGVLKVRENSTSSSYSKYTFYLVYNYKNNGNQNAQMGKTFTGTITGKMIQEKMITSRDTLESLKVLNPNLAVTTSSTLNPDFSKIAPLTISGESNYNALVTSTNYITYGDDVTYDSETGHYTLTNYVTCLYRECYNNLIGKYVIRNADYSYGMDTNTPVYQSVSETHNEVDKITNASVEGIEGFMDLISYTGSELNAVKNGTWQPQTSGVFELPDDYGTSYYFRGDVNNNYVKFAGNYWRIIRINGNGSIRMIYSGDASVIDALYNKLEVLANGYDDSSTKYTQIGSSEFNGADVSGSSYDDNAYVGYMYGTLGSDNYNDTHTNIKSSKIKTNLDNWYENNIKNTENETYIADSIFCNDRSVASNEAIEYANTNWGSNYTTNAFGTNHIIYGAYGRQIEQFIMKLGNRATLRCPQKNDAFTVSDTEYGNGSLSYPIGLITSDEANIAGGTDDGNNNYYLTTHNWYWTMSPYYNESYTYGLQIGSFGEVQSYSTVNATGGVRPVINLKPGSINAGDGTASNPFRIS